MTAGWISYIESILISDWNFIARIFKQPFFTTQNFYQVQLYPRQLSCEIRAKNP